MKGNVEILGLRPLTGKGYHEIVFHCARVDKDLTTSQCEESQCNRYFCCDLVASILDEEKLINGEEV